MIYGLTSRSRCAFSINASGEGKSSSENVNTLPHDYYSLNPWWKKSSDFETLGWSQTARRIMWFLDDHYIHFPGGY